MKLATVSRGVETSVSNTTAMSISNSAHMFSILSDKLYSDKIRAVLREIACNALDACGRVKVTMPSRLDPMLTIRDFGPGMSHEFMTGGYTVVGHSTKTNDNSVVGGFGIGRMAVFAYADAYTVTSITDLKRTYAVFRGDNGLPQVTLADASSTDEATGVEIKVPVQHRDVYAFLETAKDVFRWFPEGSVEGVTISHVQPTVQGDGWSMIKPVWDQPCYVKMGPVAYQVDWRQVGFGPIPSMIVPVFDIGQLSLAPNRESLSYDRQTVAALKERAAGIMSSLPAAIRVRAENLNPVERIRLVEELSQHRGLSEVFRAARQEDGFGTYLPRAWERIELCAPMSVYYRGRGVSLCRIPSCETGFLICNKRDLDFEYVFRDDPGLKRIWDRLDTNFSNGTVVLVSPSEQIPTYEALEALLPGLTIYKLSQLEPPYRVASPRGPARIFVRDSYDWKVKVCQPEGGIYVPFTITTPDAECERYLELARLCNQPVYGLTQTALRALGSEGFIRIDDWAKQRAAEVKADPNVVLAYSAQEVLRELKTHPIVQWLVYNSAPPPLQVARELLTTLKLEAASAPRELSALINLGMIEAPAVVDIHRAEGVFARLSRRNQVFETMARLQNGVCDIDISGFAR